MAGAEYTSAPAIPFIGEPKPVKPHRRSPRHLPSPRTPEHSDWRRDSACRHYVPTAHYDSVRDLFHVCTDHLPDGKEVVPLGARRRLKDSAKRVCETCPVLKSCALFALTSDRGEPESVGIWAGLDMDTAATNQSRTLRVRLLASRAAIGVNHSVEDEIAQTYIREILGIEVTA